MAKGITVRPLKNTIEEKRFTEISRYCFNDTTNWTARIFPLRLGDRAWGAFDGTTLESGMVTRNFTAWVFGASVPLSGISLVQTPPEYRNKSNISALFHHVLKSEYKSGKMISALYPFSFRYYGKYGYGILGGPLQARFTPESLTVGKPLTGAFRAFDGSARDIASYYTLREAWTERYSFGIRSRPIPAQAFREGLSWSGDTIIYHMRGRTPAGMIRLKKRIVEQYVSDMEIRNIAWRDHESFRALLYLIKTHRNQIREFYWYMPANTPLALCTDEPRISQTVLNDWMARPLDLPALLRLKAKQRPVAREITFAVKDDILPHNSGTYKITGDKVTQDKAGGAPLLPLPLLSSLLCGGVSLAEARLTGAVRPDALPGAEEFFQRDRDVFFNEFF